MGIPSRIAQQSLDIWRSGVAAVDARALVRNCLRVEDGKLQIGQFAIQSDQFEKLLVVGAGKASGWMADGLEQALGKEYAVEKKLHGRINVPDDQVAPTQFVETVGCRPAGENLPTSRVLESTGRILDLLQDSQNDLCICLISGGGSALLEKPVPPLALDDVRKLTTNLSRNGAAIEELNVVRKQLSQVKGGRLVELASCKKIFTLIVSDVIGDPIEMIASGPTFVADRFADDKAHSAQQAITVLQTYFGTGLEGVAESVKSVLFHQDVTTTEKQLPRELPEVTHQIIGNNQLAVASAQHTAIEMGYECETTTTADDGDVVDLSKRLVGKLVQATKDFGDSGANCFICGGEPTVRLCPNPGKGGRNQQLIALAMLELAKSDALDGFDYCLLSGGTDGEDGNVPVAGAYLDAAIIDDLKNSPTLLRELADAAANHNIFPMLRKLGCLIETPATRTNVCDVRVLVSRPK